MDLNYHKKGNGGPVFLLHGLFGSSDNWYSVARVLSDHYTVYLIDQRNHGDSPFSDAWNYGLMAQDVKRVAEKEGLDQVCVLGHSMGGKTAMEMTIRYPGMINRVMVVDIGPKAYPVRHRQIIDALKSIELDKVEKRQDADRQLSTHIHDQQLRGFLLKNLDRNSDGGFSWKINLDVIDREIEELGKGQQPEHPVNIPALFVRGGNSDYILEEDEGGILEFFPQASFVTIPDAGHWLHAEQPEAFIEVVRDFFSC
jgi:pimeloyl-ACP methyl ester carboxylesterase